MKFLEIKKSYHNNFGLKKSLNSKLDVLINENWVQNLNGRLMVRKKFLIKIIFLLKKMMGLY